jgi:aspartyl-tRNA(Asn)/glutamyl-tRNA(Gln) amidotransferase subunit A
VPSDSAIEIAARIRSRGSSAAEELAATRQACEASDPRLNAFVHLDWAGAESHAREVDHRLARGDHLGPLAGVPFAVKDLQDVAGMPTTRGSKLHRADPLPQEDSPSVARLRGAGGVPIGKTATAEYGMDSATATVAWGVTRNPWDITLTPGGSSGGSAAAVSAGVVSFATGTDEGGSIRSPASFCGLVGLKSTHGLVPRDDGTSDTNVIGVLTRTVADTALLLEVMTGPDPRDKMSQLGDGNSSFLQAAESLDVSGLRASWSSDLGYAAVESEIATHCEAAAGRLIEACDLNLVERLVSIEEPAEIWMRLTATRFRARLTALDLWPRYEEELDPTSRDFLAYASALTTRDLGEAEIARLRLESQVAELFADVDLLITPTVACDPFAAEGPVPDTIAGRKASLVGPEPFTMLANLSWLPAVSLPAGLSAAGLPVGLQVHARWGNDHQLLRLARIWEQAAPWPGCAPGWN